MTNASPSQLPSISRPSYSCVRCSDRKVKCDRQNPCGACVKHDASCVFRPLPMPRKRQRRKKDDDLQARLKHYETLLEERGINHKALADSLMDDQDPSPAHSKGEATEGGWHLPTPTSSISEAPPPMTKTQLLQSHGSTNFVDNSLWTRVAEEVHDPEQPSEDETWDDTCESVVSEKDFDHLLEMTHTHTATPLHPPAPQMLDLWYIYLENVDPVTKMLHIPSVQPAVEKAAANSGNIPRSFEALLFSIYALAVMSMKQEECEQRFGDNRKSLLARYISATKIALSRANFMTTNNIVVLQALVLHVFCVRYVYEPRITFVLTGMAANIAECMGLHRDGHQLGLSPFDAEIRRRVWWQLKWHEFRAAELNGRPKFHGLSNINTTDIPLNVNDIDLQPNMSSLPPASTKPTEMIFCAIRSELGTLASNLAAKFRAMGKSDCLADDFGFMSDIWGKEIFVQEFEETLETKFLRYCDPTNPLQLMTMLFGRSAMNVCRFISDHPRRWTNPEEIPESRRKHVWDVSINLLEQYVMMYTNPQLSRFSWYVSFYIQWHCFIHVLDTLRVEPTKPGNLRAWQLVETIYDHNPEMMFNTKRLVFVALGGLCLKAFDAWEAAHNKTGIGSRHVPNFIIKLRQQREDAKIKKQQRRIRYERAKTGSKSNRLSSMETQVTSENRQPIYDSNAGFQISSQPHPVENVGGQLSGNSNDAFWAQSGFDDGTLNLSNYSSDTSPDFMLAQEQLFGVGLDQPMDWTHWDVWLADKGMLNNPMAHDNDAAVQQDLR